jgi:hypothetical protein
MESTLTQPQRVCVVLDPALVLERLVLQRLSGLTRKRSREWLRALLVQGFLVEARWLRIGAGERAVDAAPCPTTPFAAWLEGAQRPPAPSVTPCAPPPPRRDTQTAAESIGKPFAHLRQIIG